jgi:hypothetical protein
MDPPDATVRTNVLGVFYIAQAAAKYWVKTKFTEGEFWSPSSNFSERMWNGNTDGSADRPMLWLILVIKSM